MTNNGNLSWDDVFGDLDVRSLDHDGRLDFINSQIEAIQGERTWAAVSGGEETQLVWAAAVKAFLAGNWLASVLCCHAVCEREVAGILSLSRIRSEDLPKGWERFGLGALLAEVRKRDLLPDSLVVRLFGVAESRKPYGHWRSTMHDDSLLARTRRESEATGQSDRATLVERLIVRDATNSMTASIELYFGSFGLGRG